MKASCRAEELFAFSGSVCARHSRESPGNAGFLKSLPRATKKARQGRAIPWRREEDVRRLRLESVVSRGGTVRVFGLGARASLARTSGENQISQISSLRHEKSPPRAGRSVAQRRGFEPPDESPPSHDFQSCSLNHSDISAKPCNHIIFPRKRQLILRAFRQKVFGKFLFSPPLRSVREKTRKACLERGKIMQKSGRI